MYSVSNNFKTYIAMPNRTFETKALVGATSYDNTKVVEFNIEDSVITSDDFNIGNVIPSKLTITIKSTDSIATNAKISPAVRLYDIPGWTEWVPLGSYYIDSRTYQNNVWKFTCYDKLILAQQAYVSSLTYPAHMSTVMNEIVGQLGIELDSSVVINSSYMIPYKDEDITIRDMISYIASAHGASVRMTKDEKLAFVKFIPGATHTPVLASDYFKVSQTNPLKTYTKILLTYNADGETLTSGSGDDDHTLKLYNPFMSQSMLDSVLNAIDGFNYTPFTMDWKGRPDLEVGDGITVTQRDGSIFSTTILTSKMSFKGGLKATTTAPSYAAQRSEFDYQGSLSKQVASAVKLEKPYYGVTIGRTNGIKVEKSDGSGKLILNSDCIEMEANNVVVLEVSVDGLKLDGPITSGGVITGAELVGALIRAGKIVGIDNDAILEIGEYGGAINTAFDGGAQPGQRNAIRLCPGTDDVGGNAGYVQVLEDGGVYFYKNDGTGQPFAYIHPDGTTNLHSSGEGGGENTSSRLIAFIGPMNTLRVVSRLVKLTETY